MTLLGYDSFWVYKQWAYKQRKEILFLTSSHIRFIQLKRQVFCTGENILLATLEKQISWTTAQIQLYKHTTEPSPKSDRQMM